MKVSILAVVVALTLGLSMGQGSESESLRADLANLEQIVEDLKKTVTDLSRQTMLQQFSVEERARTEADSGFKVVRGRNKGLKNYESPSHVGGAVNAIHNHNNYMRTLGMGEVSVSMNGVNFRTRHNDYKLLMHSTTSKAYRATEPIAFPEVPPSVKGTIEKQVDEMKEWFKAFVAQDYSVRDYRKYFIPVICYMEGTWTLDKELVEPFDSDRHKIEARSWADLQNQMSFTAYTGSKGNSENIAYLPTTIYSVNETTGAVNYAQWNYRILCKPTNKDIPLQMLHQVDDLAFRMRDGKTVEQTLETRAARFNLYDDEQSDNYQILDEVFYGIPGMDNIPSDNLTEATLGGNELIDEAYSERNVPLKTGYYHRQYRFLRKGAMGQTLNPRGFNDDNMWVAQNTQPRVAPASLEVCRNRKKLPPLCHYEPVRFSYALPLEIVYMTPLLSWNPYNIQVHQDLVTAKADGADGRKKPYNGADLAHYYLTPFELFSGKRSKDQDAADTEQGTVKVRDKRNNVRNVVASGTRIILPEIPDVGQVRLRYPIAPISNEGSPVWKELNALKDFVFAMQDRLDMSISEDDLQKEVEPEKVFFLMSTTVAESSGEHTHELSVPYKLFKNRLLNGKFVKVTTTLRQGHTHTLRLEYYPEEKKFRYTKCGSTQLCWDEHPTPVYLTTKNSFTEL